MAKLPVKYFDSQMAGAPALNNQWGALVNLLDACLVTGFNTTNVTSIVRTDTTATVTISGGHSYRVNQVVEIAGATQSDYNGEFFVNSTTATTFTITVPSTVATPATTASGITVRVASLGWEKQFSGTNKGAYRSKNPLSPKNVLLVDASLEGKGSTYQDGYAKWANVGIVEKMTDINTRVGAQAPFDPLNPNKNWGNDQKPGWFRWYWSVANNGSDSAGGVATNQPWVLIGDDRLFYLYLSPLSHTTQSYQQFAFGDILSFRVNDPYATILVADDRDITSVEGYGSWPGDYSGNGLVNPNDSRGKLLLRPSSQVGNCVGFTTMSIRNAGGESLSGRGEVQFPNGPDFGILMLPCYVRENSPINIRGTLPGAFWLPQTSPLVAGTVLDSVSNLPGRKVIFLNQFVGGNQAQMAFDMTGPWR